jgi:N-acetylmuramoyl-L-alanine amidase
MILIVHGKGGGKLRVIFFRPINALKILLLISVFLVVGAVVGYFYMMENTSRKSVEALSWAVANKVVVVDAGHGGIDPGAVGPSGVLEKDVNLAISKKLALILSQAGAVVIMTREDDTCYSQRKREDLNARIALAEKNQADIFLSIQGNAIQSSRWTGAQTFYHPKSKPSKELAVAIQDELGRILKNTKRKARPHTEAYILKQLNCPTVVVEVGFMSNPVEERLLNDSFYQNKVAWSVYAGVVKYFSKEK